MHAWQPLQFQSCGLCDSWCYTEVLRAGTCCPSSILAGYFIVLGFALSVRSRCAGRSSLADDILSNKFQEIAPIFGSKIEGKDKFKSTIDGLFSVSLAAFGLAYIAVVAKIMNQYVNMPTFVETSPLGWLLKCKAIKRHVGTCV